MTAPKRRKKSGAASESGALEENANLELEPTAYAGVESAPAARKFRATLPARGGGKGQVLGVVIGGRVGYMLFYQPGLLLDNPLQLFYIWQGGMSFHGGMLGVVILDPRGRLPPSLGQPGTPAPVEASRVRIEEMVNYFDYDYPLPADRSQPFRADVSIMPTPWNAETRLMRIGIKGYEIERAEAPKANLVFLIDTSGSMNAPDKLPLLRQAFRMLVSNLRPDDVVSIVTYAGSAGTVLEPTKVSETGKIFAALDNLSAGGSTARSLASTNP